MTDCVHCGETAVRGHESPHGLPHCSAECLEAAGVVAGLVPPDAIGQAGAHYWRDSRGRYHRDYDLPAMMSVRGYRRWYRHGALHRDGGRPAVVRGKWFVDYWLDGVQYTAGTYTVRYA